MNRRQFASHLAAGATAFFLNPASLRSAAPEDGVTREVAAFIVNTRYSDIPSDVMELGKKSILDGLGLALSGSVAETGRLSREYLKSFLSPDGEATVIGSPMKAPVRFAAFANGVGIHADDYDDTQL